MFKLSMKRVVHYLLLAAVLVGLLMWCAYLTGYDEMLADVAAFPPWCEEWLDDSTRLWRVKCPFNWWVFALFALITAAMVVPFVLRMWRSRSLRPAGAVTVTGAKMWSNRKNARRTFP